MEKRSTSLYRFAVLVAVCMLALIASGSYVTASLETAAPADQAAAATPAPAGEQTGLRVHLYAAAIVGLLVLGLAVWLSIADRTGLRPLAWIAVIAMAIDAYLGRQADSGTLAPSLAAAHASIAPVLFASLVLIAILTSPSWKSGPELTDDRGWPALRYLAVAMPPLVLVQIVLGALYRHRLTGVLLHMGGAMLVAITVLVVSMVVLQQYPTHRPLRRAATALVSILLVQVSFGIAAFTLQLLDQEGTAAFAISAASHVVVGSLTLAASLAMAIEIQRSILPAKS